MIFQEDDNTTFHVLRKSHIDFGSNEYAVSTNEKKR